MKSWRQLPLELIFWIAALVLLGWNASTDMGTQAHFTVCPLANLGFSWCPGCGIGRAIGHLLNGHIEKSIAQHWFGIPALMIISYRIIGLIRMMYRSGIKIILKRKERNYV